MQLVVERVHGIWCYEADARESMCSKMEECVGCSPLELSLTLAQTAHALGHVPDDTTAPAAV